MGNITSEPHYTIREIHRKNLYDKQENHHQQRLRTSPFHHHSMNSFGFPGLYNQSFSYFPNFNMNNLPFPTSFYHQQPTSMFMNQGWNQPLWNHYPPNYTMYPFH
ncbi:unnamed protein product [Cunninghamella blakesleeana]